MKEICWKKLRPYTYFKFFFKICEKKANVMVVYYIEAFDVNFSPYR